jgi:predicted  nucleic acid-binding Zn-ribbon protein
MTIDARLKGFLRRLAHPLWRRIWARIETRLTLTDDRIATLEKHIPTLENCSSTLGDHIATLENRNSALEDLIPILENRISMLGDLIVKFEGRISALEDRISTLEVEWQENSPAILNTVSTVGAFGHELVHIRRDLEEKIAVLRKEIDAASREMHPDPESRLLE